jgi:hypothetical protein
VTHLGDVMVAWKLHSGEARDAFREVLPIDDPTNEPRVFGCPPYMPGIPGRFDI